MTVRVTAYPAPALAGDAQDHVRHAQADDGIEDRRARGDCHGACDDGERDVCVDAGVVAVCSQGRAVEAAPGSAAYQRCEPTAREADRAGEGEDGQMARRGWMDEAQDRLVGGDARGDEDGRDDR
jgi:hypothetical protein